MGRGWEGDGKGSTASLACQIDSGGKSLDIRDFYCSLSLSCCCSRGGGRGGEGKGKRGVCVVRVWCGVCVCVCVVGG